MSNPKVYSRGTENMHVKPGIRGKTLQPISCNTATHLQAGQLGALLACSQLARQQASGCSTRSAFATSHPRSHDRRILLHRSYRYVSILCASVMRPKAFRSQDFRINFFRSNPATSFSDHDLWLQNVLSSIITCGLSPLLLLAITTAVFKMAAA